MLLWVVVIFKLFGFCSFSAGLRLGLDLLRRLIDGLRLGPRLRLDLGDFHSEKIFRPLAVTMRRFEKKKTA